MSSIESEGYKRAVELLHACASSDGFLASTSQKDNYRRVWGRDGVILSLTGLLLDDDFTHIALQTLRTLKTYQGPHGEIPSNVDPSTGHVSLGGTTGRVDADLWYLIGCARYYEVTGDLDFLEEFCDSIERVVFLLGAWEFNNRGLLYVPQTGDWSDEYIQHGYVLYDQALYYRALRGAESMMQALQKHDDQVLSEKSARLHDLIRGNYWFIDCDLDPPHAYHPVLHKKGCEASEHRNQHWMAFFSPTGYGYRFDTLANTFVSLFNIADDEQREHVDRYISEQVVHEKMTVLPAFDPVIEPEDDAWNDLEVSFSFSFKNKPYEFHNGGLWPMVTGFYVVDLCKRGKGDVAKRYIEGIDTANSLDAEGHGWGFYEFLHGKNYSPMGTRHQGWSAAASIMAHEALQGNYIL